MAHLSYRYNHRLVGTMCKVGRVHEMLVTRRSSLVTCNKGVKSQIIPADNFARVANNIFFIDSMSKADSRIL